MTLKIPFELETWGSLWDFLGSREIFNLSTKRWVCIPSNSRGHLVPEYLFPVYIIHGMYYAMASSAKITKNILCPVFIEILSCWQACDCCNPEFTPCTYNRRASISWMAGNRYHRGPRMQNHPRKGEAHLPHLPQSHERAVFIFPSEIFFPTEVFQLLHLLVLVLFKLEGPRTTSLGFSPVL